MARDNGNNDRHSLLAAALSRLIRHSLLAAALSWLISVLLFLTPEYLSISGGWAATLKVVALALIGFSICATGYTIDELTHKSNHTFATIGISGAILVFTSQLHLLSNSTPGQSRLFLRILVLLLGLIGGFALIVSITNALPLARKEPRTEVPFSKRRRWPLSTAIFTALVGIVSLATAVVQFLAALENP